MSDAFIEQLIAARGGRGGVTPPSATQALATPEAYATQDRLRAAPHRQFHPKAFGIDEFGFGGQTDEMDLVAAE